MMIDESNVSRRNMGRKDSFDHFDKLPSTSSGTGAWIQYLCQT